jgi:quinol-cytochrome oxidoreductase complex cytochrome b subunit
MEPGEIIARKVFNVLGWVNVLALCVLSIFVTKNPEWEWALYANLGLTVVLVACWYFFLGND